jgi:signal transduction histidine kinase
VVDAGIDFGRGSDPVFGRTLTAMTDARWQMLPGGLLEEPGAKRSARDWIVDLTMFGLALVVSLFVFATSEDLHSQEMTFYDLVLGAVAFVSLWWRRRFPFAVALIAIVPGAISAFAAGPGLVAFFNVALRGSRRAIVASTVLSVAAGVVFYVVYPDDEMPFALELLFIVVISFGVLAWGLFARTQRSLLRSSHERARQLESEQRAHVEQAREAERRRIASEMHDVLAHRLSLLSVHAGALEFRPDAPPEEIASAAAVIRETARSALQELREVIGVLREQPVDGIAPPQPTLDAIPSLIEESRAAGMRVASRIEAGGGEDTVGRTAYRVVQEGLTNARKHAPAATVEVTVAASERLVVEVISRRSALARPAEPGGSGLIGLAERVALAGGALEHGPNPRGDYVLRATLPWS